MEATVEEAAQHLEDLRVAEVELLDMNVDNKLVEYRARIHASFRYHPEKRITSVGWPAKRLLTGGGPSWGRRCFSSAAGTRWKRRGR